MRRYKSQPLGVSWVLAQLVLFGVIFFAPVVDDSVPPTLLAVPLGLVVGGFGLGIALLAILQLGGSLSIFPRPVDGGSLVQNGVYALARHPIYTGVILSALGYSIVQWSWLALAVTLILGLFFDRKAAHEERMLGARYADYADYKARVKKLIPWVY